MRTYCAPIGIQPVNNIDGPSSEFIEFLLHETPATADVLEESGTTSLFTDGLFDVGGTSAGYWSDSGWWTPAGDHDGRINSDAARAFFLAAGFRGHLGLIIDLKFTNATLTDPLTLLDVGLNKAVASQSAGYDISVSTAKDFKIRYRNGGDGSISNGAVHATSLSNNTRYVLGAYFDFSGSTPRCSTLVDGVTADQEDADMTTMTAGLPIYPTQPVGLFNRVDSNGNVLYPLGSSSSGVAVNALRILRRESDFMAEWQLACLEQYLNPFRTRLRHLSGL